MSEDIHKWSDGRYTLMFDEHTFFVFDNVKDDRMTALNVTKRLNEQQATISKQLDQIIELQDKYRILEFNHSRLEKRNKAQYEKIGEQQATIRKLQDLCGESDGENAKLRIENKELQEEIKLLKPTNVEQYEQIVQLQEENEQLRKELGDCEKFRYTVFQRLNDEYIKERSIK